MTKRKSRRRELFVKIFSIVAIYLILSLTFFTAQTFARLDYSISGDRDVEGFARRQGDSIKIITTSDSNVSFVTGSGTSSYRETPLNGCSMENGVVTCSYPFSSTQININLKSIPFTLKQVSGSPQYKNGILYIDSLPPIVEYLDVIKNASGLLFKYKVTDYLYSYSQNDCTGSGIGEIEIHIQGNSYDALEIVSSNNCSVQGEYFVNLEDTSADKLTYYVSFRDRAGNNFDSDLVVISGDFAPPQIQDTFKVMRGTEELTQISGSTDTIADILVVVEDSNVSVSGIRGDLSSLNINPAINIPYKDIGATCTKDTGNVYNCVFSSIVLKPTSENPQITIFATDNDGNVASKTISGSIVLKNNPGQVLFIGTTKEHCTQDLSSCYAKSGMTLFRVEVDGQSSYEKNVLNLGVDSTRTFAICNLDEDTQKWICTGVYNIPKDSNSVSLFLADSADDFGNRLSSDIERTVYVDNIVPVKTSDLKVVNSNNNNNCSVSGDELTFSVRVKEVDSPELKIYSNTTNFTTSPMQIGTCDKISDDEWQCTLPIKDFSSTPNTLTNNIIVEDLAGNKLQIPYLFRICQSSSNAPPNTITGFIQTSTPKIDRRTASIIPIKTYVTGNFKIMNGAQLMYLQIDRCTSKGIDGLDIMSSGHYFIPGYGVSQTLVLNIGHEQAQLPEGRVVINCTISARINIGQTVYNSDEREVIQINIDTFNQPLGSLDETTLSEIRSQKQALRDLDEELEVYELIDKIVGLICDISDIIVKVNSILQAIKAVMYPICIVIYSFGGEGIWNVINGVASAVDTQFVQPWVWPTGGAGTAPGYIWKYLCIAYNCRFYTMSGLVELGFDAAGFIKKANADKVESKSEVVPKYEKDASGNKIPADDANGRPPSDPNWEPTYKQAMEGGKPVYLQIKEYKDGRVEVIESVLEKQTVLDPDQTWDDTSKPPPTKEFELKTPTKTTTTYKNGDQKIVTTGTVDGKPYTSTTTIQKQPNGDFVSQTVNPIATTTDYYDSKTGETRRVVFRSVTPSAENNFATGQISEQLYDKNRKPLLGADGKPIVNNYYTFPNTQTKSSGGFLGGIGKSLLGGGESKSSYTILQPTGTQGEYLPVNKYISDSYQDIASGKSTLDPGSGAYLKDKDGEFAPGNLDEVNNQYSVYSIGAQGAVYNDIARQDWIINPYRSVYYDGLCVPAIMYNMQKERQIRCMYVQCLEDSQNNGMPVTVCKNLYATNNCIYLESAQHVLDKNIWESIGRGFIQQAISFAMGFAVQFTYQAVCQKYIKTAGMGTLADVGWEASTCGVFGALLKWQEVAAILQSPQEVMKNLFKGAGVGNPEDIHDYCEGGKLYEN